MYILVSTSVVEGEFGGQDVKVFTTRKAATENLRLQYNAVYAEYGQRADYFGEVHTGAHSAYTKIADIELVWIIYKK